MRQFTEEQEMFRESYRKFVEQEIKPHMPEWRKAGIVDRSAFKKAGGDWATTIFDMSRLLLKKPVEQVALIGITLCIVV